MVGTVKVCVDKGCLRLQFPSAASRQIWNVRQKYVALGLSDTPENRVTAQQLAFKAQIDILTGNPDMTLQRYKPFTKKPIDETNSAFSKKTMPIYKLTIRWGPDEIIFQALFDNVPPNSSKLKQLIQSQIAATAGTRKRVMYCLEKMAGMKEIIKEFPRSGGAIQLLWRDTETSQLLGSIQLTEMLVLKSERYQD